MSGATKGCHWVGAATVIFISSWAWSVDSSDATPRAPVPSTAEQTQAADALKDVLNQASAGTPATRDKTLPKKLLDAAMQPDTKPAEKYVLLKKAIDLSAHAGDVASTLAECHELTSAFDVDGLTVTIDALQSSSKRQNSDEDLLLDASESIVTDALAANRFDAAKRAVGLAAIAARRINDPVVVREVSDRQEQVSELETGSAQATAAEATLKKSPDDAAAAQAAGDFYCFAQADWTRGVPLLAKGHDATLASLAKADLDAQKDSMKALPAADAWWDWAGKQSGMRHAKAQERAVEWYRRAAPSLNGVVKLRVDSRLTGQQAARYALSKSVVVPVAANREWQQAIEVTKGDLLLIRADGVWCNAVSQRKKATTDADGANSTADYFVQGARYGSLIGQIGDKRFMVGKRLKLEAQDSGQLEMRINDDGVSDNDGELTVTIRRFPAKP